MLFLLSGTSSFAMAVIFEVRVSTKNGNTRTFDVDRYSEM